jgi:hypothetical protein
LAASDLVEFGKRAFELFVEEPHRIEDLSVSRRRFGPVGLSKGEDAVVSQIGHDLRIRNAVAGQVA